MTAEEMYQEAIMDSYRNPANFGFIEKAEIKARDVNPSCGDVIEMNLKVKNGNVEDVKFSGKGCAISIAAASMLTEEIKGKPLQEIRKINKENIFEMLGIKLSMMRVKCALLGLKVMKVGIYEYLGEKEGDEESA